MLGQSVKNQLQPLVRGIATSSQSFGIPATAPTGSLLSLVGLTGSRVDVPLNEALPNPPALPRASSVVTPSFQSSTLSSGVKLATLNSASPVSSIALLVEGGSSAETPSTIGASKVLELMAFKSSTNRSTFRFTRELEKLGANAYVKAGRDSVVFGVDALRIYNQEAIEILADAIVNQRNQFWEVRDVLEQVKEQLAASLADPKVVLEELIHKAAFDGALGNSLIVDPSEVNSFTSDNLKEYVDALLSSSNIVLAGAGVDHASLKDAATPLFAAGASAPTFASKFVGGSISSVSAASPLVHATVAFEAQGGSSSAKSKALALIAKALLDSPSAIPYNGLNDAVLTDASSFATLYKSTGLVGVTASAPASKSGEILGAVAKKIQAAAQAGESSVAAAKAKALGALLGAGSTSVGAVSCIGKSALYGSASGAEVAAAISAATAADVSAYTAALVKSTPAIATYGSLNSLPRVPSKLF
mmetsp:Transcript_29471/g.54095  ORF Transcript_29471/g.54095 Transcript_29471/m.54095 type:complete len:475 (-) Transcript_29471:202-1626(-)|eukprot:CAMPEP_0175054076 /NCGR_PEP_ID=MMETSP0052_2-20121109/9296_1 /TAXON_ID=51329 ORGANISM="Polytomella parva, Strain SAG 63-3" /NCGR_SAMPLE_ID=MMETSP0052_2 /ASSEMBLY_ACC=CAM_ASM_000194 /LENGTH=474 /DNA_ID=CAMNT_0016318715 /DNA_START=118 /DNA_END=1542 /DNA_ORIENTATION=+